MALQRAISACEEDHESYIMQLPDADIAQLISKADEDGRCDIFLMSSSVLREINGIVSCRTAQDRSLLHAAVSSGKTNIVQYLLSKGASPNTSDDEVELPQTFSHPPWHCTRACLKQCTCKGM